MVDIEKFSALVEDIYGASIDAEKLALLPLKIAGFLDAPSAVIQIRPTIRKGIAALWTTENFTAKGLADYVAHYHAVDELVLRGAKIPLDTAFQRCDVIPNAEYDHTEIWTDYGKHYGLYDVVGAMFATEFGICVFGAHRSFKEKRFDPTETKHMLELILPHLRKALELRARLDDGRIRGEVGLDGLDRLSVGVLVVDSSGRLIFANSKGEAVLGSARGLAVRHGRVVTSNPRFRDRLTRAIAQAVLFPEGLSQEPSGYIALPDKGVARPLTLKVLPLPLPAMPLAGSWPLAAIFIGEPGDMARGLTELLRQLYGLTAAETRLVEALLKGDSLKEYAESVGVSFDTVRTHMKHVLAKTGTSRQAELIGELMRNPVLRMSSCRHSEIAFGAPRSIVKTVFASGRFHDTGVAERDRCPRRH
jgi:DNA-binding CsgD family transcriptional regulator